MIRHIDCGWANRDGTCAKSGRGIQLDGQACEWFAPSYSSVLRLRTALDRASQFAADMSGSCPLDMFDYQAGNCEFECRDDYAECWRRYFEKGDGSR